MISIRRARPAIAEMAVERIDALADAARTAGRRGIPRFTRFLDPAEAEAARRLARAEGVVCTLWGGYEDAERAIACFHPLDETVDASQFPLVCLHSRILTRYGALTHRDLLGAFMALGLTRACIGDMIIRDADAYLFTTEEMAPYIRKMDFSLGGGMLNRASCAMVTTGGTAVLSITKLTQDPAFEESLNRQLLQLGIPFCVTGSELI